MTNPGFIESAFGERVRLAQQLGDLAPTVATIASAVTKCLQDGGTIFACGNGGSATQAQHFAAELVGRFKSERRALPAFALADNTAAVTSIANDYAYEEIFSRQIDGLGKKGDCLVALSTSGRSANVVRACVAARERGMRVFALTGEGGGDVAALSDTCVQVPHSDTALVQEAHLVVIHLLCELVESTIFPDNRAD